jgi:hypothetical protein
MWSGDKAFVQNLDQRDGAGQGTHRHINSVAEIAATIGATVAGAPAADRTPASGGLIVGVVPSSIS